MRYCVRRPVYYVLSTTSTVVPDSTPVVPDSTILEALLPNNFLLGKHAVNFPSLTFDKKRYVTAISRKRFVRAQAYAKVNWLPWLKEYARPFLEQTLEVAIRTAIFELVISSGSPIPATLLGITV